MELNTPAIPVAPVAEEPVVPVAPVVTPELRYEYQPTDEQGRPLGGKQVIVYKTPDELAQKLSEQNSQLVRKLREVTRKQKLGITDDAELPADTELATFVTPTPRTLSAEELFTLSQDLQDPAKSVEAVNTIFEASVGLTSAQMRQQFNDAQIAKLQHQAYVNYQIFEKQAGDLFYPCAENAQVLTDWMFKKQLAPTVKNFEIAASKLKEAGLLLDSPIVREVAPTPTTPAPAAEAPVAPVSTEPNSQVPVAPESRITPGEQPQTKRPVRVPSGLNARVASDGTDNQGVTVAFTLADIEKMPAEIYKQKMKDPAFRKMVDELENQAIAHRRAKSNAS
jgi:hypothetical protein